MLATRSALTETQKPRRLMQRLGLEQQQRPLASRRPGVLASWRPGVPASWRLGVLASWRPGVLRRHQKKEKPPRREAKKSRRRPTLARASPALPSAMEPLTSVFGMGTGVTTPLWPPAKSRSVGNLRDLQPTTRCEGSISHHVKSEKIS